MAHQYDDRPLIVGIGGTTRAGSSSERALSISLRAAEAEGASVVMLSGTELEMPMYAPERPERSSNAQRLLSLVSGCDGLILSSPSYHGGISGMLKNALDYTEDLRNGDRCYLSDCPVGLIACGAGWQGAATALSALRSIVHALRGWPTPLGVMLNSAGGLFDADGNCVAPNGQAQLEAVGRQVMQFASAWKTARLTAA
ncbi:FMN reductase [Variovorax sp. HW608]|uniref:NADPH-dependent FMN reductase n=1 Tax=Variovorax sp. HW608 TaxID=1034889 RepID=UPI00081F9194|nr:NADPH-dependent FMN reductase [Variovorax sp. HW608]SCK14852.1 FMN reductase [Variovorax sp. HW608]